MKPIRLSPQSEEQIKALDELYRHSKDGRVRQRAHIVLLAAELGIVLGRIDHDERQLFGTGQARLSLGFAFENTQLLTEEGDLEVFLIRRNSHRREDIKNMSDEAQQKMVDHALGKEASKVE